MKRNFKLVVADIDGTLVNEARKCTPLTQYVLTRLHDMGTMFGLASGRPADELDYLHAKWEIAHPFALNIGMNGGQVSDHLLNSFESYYLLSEKKIEEIIESMAIFDYARPCMYLGNRVASDQYNERLAGTGKRAGKELLIVKDKKEFWAKPNNKVMFRIPSEKSDEMMAYINSHPIANTMAFKTQPTMIEFTDTNVSKAVALGNFCKTHGIKKEEVIAFGDTSNDNAMLKWAGLGVCLRNGSDDTKKIADVITDLSNDEDGFAHFMLEYVLKNR